MSQNDPITEMHTDVKWIKKELEGNGKPGLIQRVAENTKYRLIQTGVIIAFCALMGWQMITIKGLV